MYRKDLVVSCAASGVHTSKKPDVALILKARW